MSNTSYTKERTALLFVDPYNDFLSEGGKLWPLVEGVAREVGLLHNLRKITAAIRPGPASGSLLCRIIAGSPATMKAGTIRTLPRLLRTKGKPSPKGVGVVSGTPILRRKRVISSSRNIGGRADLPTPISISG